MTSPTPNPMNDAKLVGTPWMPNQWEYQYDLPIRGGSGDLEVSAEKAKEDSALNGLGGFGESLFKGIFDVVGQIVGGVTQLFGAVGAVAVKVVGGLFDGVRKLLGGIFGSVSNVFNKRYNQPQAELPPVYNTFNTGLEQAIEPFFEDFDAAKEKAEKSFTEITTIRQEFDTKNQEVTQAIADTNTRIDNLGDLDSILGDKAKELTDKAEAAVNAANNAVQELEDYKGENTQELTQLKVKIDSAQNEAIEANTKAIRLAFPDINLIPYIDGRPSWTYTPSVTHEPVPNIPTGSHNPKEQAWRATGTPTLTNQGKTPITIPSDLREFRLRAHINVLGTQDMKISLKTPDGQDAIEAIRWTQPDDETEDTTLAANLAWTPATDTTYHPRTAGWQDWDMVVRLTPGTKEAYIEVATQTNHQVIIHDLRMLVFYPAQAEVDFAQNRAIKALQNSIELNNKITKELEAIAQAQRDQLDALMNIQKESVQVINRILQVQILEPNTAVEQDEYIRVEKPTDHRGGGQFKIIARGDKWTGSFVMTSWYPLWTRPIVVDLKPGADRVYQVPRFAGAKLNGNDNKIHALRIDYQVNAKQQEVSTWAQGPGSVGGGWVEQQPAAFTATAEGEHIVGWNIQWSKTSQHNYTWGIRIRKNNEVVKVLEAAKIGPLWPWESGVRWQQIQWTGDLKPGDKLAFDTFTSENMPTTQRAFNSMERKIGWLTD